MAPPNFYVKHQSASSIPCAVHRPPHQKGRRKSASKCKSAVTASIKAICNEVRGTAENRPSQLQKPSKTEPGTSQNLRKSTAGAPQDAKTGLRSATDQQREGQEGPRRAQETPKKCPTGARSCPRGPQSRPSDAQGRPKSFQKRPPNEFLARSLWEAMVGRLLERLCVVVRPMRKVCDV